MQKHVKTSSALRRYGHLSQSLDPLLERGMGAEQRRKCAAPKHGLYDAQRRGRRGKRGCRNALVVCPQLLQRAYQAVRLAYHSRTGFIGGELSLPRKTELQQHCGERCEK